MVVALGLTLAVTGLWAPSSPADGTGPVTGTALQLLARLTTAKERTWGYVRSSFVLWIDADGDGCDTRREVLIAESTTKVRVGPGCSIRGGTWFSVYDGRTTRNASTFDIDHVVPLKEAWDSGAWRWTAARRRAYANDLGDPRSLRAVSATSNRAKSDGDPAQWLPPRSAYRCTYVRQWIVIKVRWRLSVDSVERAALKRVLAGCSAARLSVAIVP
jgi:hypothetical protein